MNNEKYFLSVIVCCYNKEKTLEKTIDSIIAQTIFKHIEVICINDCSTDSSLDILRLYAEFYENIKVISLSQNSSVFAARLEGIKQASAPYISFVDPDDWIDPNYYLELLHEITNTKADIIITPSAFKHFGNGKTEDIKNTIHKRYMNTGIFDMNEKYFNDVMTGDTWMTIWSMVFSANVIKHVLAMPPEYINFLEDNLIFTISLMNSSKICHYETSASYHYYVGKDTEHLSQSCKIGTSYKYIIKVYTLLKLYCDSKPEKYGKYKQYLGKCSKKYYSRVVSVLYDILTHSSGFKMFFTEDFQLRPNIATLTQNENNAKVFESVKSLIRIIKDINDELKTDN